MAMRVLSAGNVIIIGLLLLVLFLQVPPVSLVLLHGILNSSVVGRARVGISRGSKGKSRTRSRRKEKSDSREERSVTVARLHQLWFFVNCAQTISILIYGISCSHGGSRARSHPIYPKRAHAQSTNIDDVTYIPLHIMPGYVHDFY